MCVIEFTSYETSPPKKVTPILIYLPGFPVLLEFGPF